MRVVEARGMYEMGVDAVRRDPTALMKVGERYRVIPVSTTGEVG